ncbi:LysE family translocator [Pseudomonas viridiflava]|uniref:LysE family translocator n=2 Tax=Pseudomonas viridiflava TaxID=33069 RepID=UPI000F0214E6|nr:LysE family transporter [Pseudomonas viridiflava]
MTLHEWLVFTLVAMLITLTPGPAVIMALSNSLAYGPGRAMIGSLGNALGLLVVSTATIAGLGALLAASATAFMVLKVAGAAYLVFLGIKQWRTRDSAYYGIDKKAVQTASVGKLILHGVSVAITNPKAILFFAAFLPQFIHGTDPAVSQLALMVATFAACAVTSHFLYAMFAQVIKKYLNSPARMQKMNRVFGVSFMLLGASLFTLKSKAA